MSWMTTSSCTCVQMTEYQLKHGLIFFCSTPGPFSKYSPHTFVTLPPHNNTHCAVPPRRLRLAGAARVRVDFV
eukprot:811469-Pleurochrysis_carterae.AAC.1